MDGGAVPIIAGREDARQGMTDKHKSPSIATLRKLEAALHRHGHAHRMHGHAHKAAGARRPQPMYLVLSHRIRRAIRRPVVRRSLIGTGAAVGAIALIFAGLWVRLASGPLEFNLATPWLAAAIEENFGSKHRVEVGGTQLERDDGGRIRLRLRDIVVRDGDGTVVASAPKAEVGLSGASLLTGSLRAERLSLVGAELAVRIETGGNITVFAGSGADQHPIATASTTPQPPSQQPAARAPAPTSDTSDAAAAAAPKNAIENVAALFAWIDSLGVSGLDGHDLAELGFKSGNLVVDDQRNGKRWSFENINLSLTRATGGGVVFSMNSEAENREWSLSAAVAPPRAGRRVFNVEARRVLAKDLLLALRFGDDPILADVPVSASLRAEIAADGSTQMLQGRVLVEAGSLADTTDPDIRIAIERAEFNLDWDPARRMLTVPFQIISGGNRLTLFAHIQPPQAQGETWNLTVNGGTVVLAANQRNDEPVIFNRIDLRGRIDPALQRITLERGDLANVENVVSLSGTLDYAGGDPRLAAGLAGTRMKVSTMKKLWPSFVAPPIRAWIEDHLGSGTVERMVIATNAPMSTLKSSGPPVPEGGLSIEVTTTDTVLRPIEGLPQISEADLNVRITGRTATINMARGSVETPSGRKLTLTNGVFEVPDTAPREPVSRTRFRVEGPVPAAADLLLMERLREFSGMPFDLSSAKGTVVAQVGLGFPLKPDLPKGSSAYSVTADIAGFSADRAIMGQKMEATSLRITATNQGYQIKGDVKIGATPATLDYRKPRPDADAEIRIQATLDEAARAKLGFDTGSAVTGPVLVKLQGQVAATDRENHFSVDADLTSAKIDNLLPGWVKPQGKATRANFTLISKAQSTRFEDIAIEGAGTLVKGSLEVDGSGDIVSANFPVFTLAEGDKAVFRADRGSDGALRVSLRGEVYDGRGFVKTAVAGARPDSKTKSPINDLDLDIRLGAVLGYNGETVRGLDLKVSRRGGNIRNFSLNAKLGRDTALLGDFRGRGSGREYIFLETKDAGALFRFTDSYPRMMGGQMWVAMDPPTTIPTAQEGILSISDFSVRGEAALDRVAGAPNAQRDGVRFSRMRAEFTRMPGRLEIRDGVVQGNIGATIDGQIDYLADEMHLRGSFVPLYQLNNMFGQLPIVGFILGGSNEGLLGVTYEVVGSPSAPRLNVNPLSAVAPGLLRKFFEYRGTDNNNITLPRR